MERILLINFGGIGDEILFLPTVLSLKKEFPESHITLALEPRSRGIADLTDKIDDLILVDLKRGNKYVELMKLVMQAWKGRYDIVVSSGANKLIPILLAGMGIKKRYGYDSGALSQKLLTQAVPLNKNQYAAAMYHDLIAPLTSHRTELPQIDVERLPVVENSVLIHPGVSKISVEKNMIKTITPDVWAEVVRRLAEAGKKVRLVGGPDDQECIERIVELCAGVEFENLYGTTKNLKELAQLISSAEKFVCSDSAPLHVAVALGVKTYAIFGPTDDRKLIPPSVVALKANDKCPLKPCLWERRQTSCENLDCLKISAESIVEKVI
ncbi:MAG: glycosyltransferase family 9 protein [Fusobacterium sp.]|nr:glycosyltransferase family 9 protein [Fusobacterium sp.]